MKRLKTTWGYEGDFSFSYGKVTVSFKMSWTYIEMAISFFAQENIEVQRFITWIKKPLMMCGSLVVKFWTVYLRGYLRLMQYGTT